MDDDLRYYPASELVTEGEGADRHFGFYSLIELFTIAQLRQRGIPMSTVRKPGRDKSVVVDPRRAFGHPVIEGTNLTTETIMSLLRGGETVENVADSFQIDPAAVLAAKAFEHIKAA